MQQWRRFSERILNKYASGRPHPHVFKKQIKYFVGPLRERKSNQSGEGGILTMAD